MDTDECRPADNDLRVALACLELDVSDSVLIDLLTSLKERRQDETNTPAAKLVLQVMDAVAGHIDSLRVQSNPEAFIIIGTLWEAYVTITTELNDKEALDLALENSQLVLDWQQRCLCTAIKTVPPAPPSSLVQPAVTELIEKQISETGNFVRQEIAALKTLAGQPVNAATLSPLDSSFMSDQLHDLQDLFQEEINKLRLEIHSDTNQSAK